MNLGTIRFRTGSIHFVLATMISVFFVQVGQIESVFAEIRNVEEHEQSASDPVVIVLLIGQTPEIKKLERNLVTKLVLSLDGITIEAVKSETNDFASLSLLQKLSRIRPYTNRFNSVATTWIEEGRSDLILLHMVSLGTGRAFVRIVEAARGPDTEVELAFAAQELLGQIYMLTPSRRGEEIERAVLKVIGDANSLRESRLQLLWGILPYLNVSGGIAGHEGQWFRYGGGLAVESLIGKYFFSRAHIGALAGPFLEPEDGVVMGWGIDVGVDFGLSFEIDNWRLGFLMGASAIHSDVSMALGRGDHFSYSWWDFRGAFGFDIRLFLTKKIAIILDPCLGIWTQRKNFFRTSDESIILTTPFMDWSAIVGVLVNL